MGNVTLEPNGGQVPWHNQEQEEVYFIVEGTGEMCLGEERPVLDGGQAVYIPPGRLPPVDQHRRHAAADDLLLRPGGRRGALAAGTRRHAAEGGREAPPLPEGAQPQCRNEAEAVIAEGKRPDSFSTTSKFVGIIMNGVTGRMGTNQHLMRSIVAIRQQGGVKRRRRSDHARAAAGRPQRGQAGGALGPAPAAPWTTELDQALADPTTQVSTSTRRRPTGAWRRQAQAIAAGKHVYCEKPTADTLERRSSCTAGRRRPA
jgi:hypothetical protein